MLCIIVFTIIIPDHMQKRDARIAYDMGNYQDVFDLLYGKDLNEEEEVLLHKSTIVMKMERKLASYQNNLKLGGHELEALNALVQGLLYTMSCRRKLMSILLWENLRRSIGRFLLFYPISMPFPKWMLWISFLRKTTRYIHRKSGRCSMVSAIRERMHNPVRYRMFCQKSRRFSMKFAGGDSR